MSRFSYLEKLKLFLNSSFVIRVNHFHPYQFLFLYVFYDFFVVFLSYLTTISRFSFFKVTLYMALYMALHTVTEFYCVMAMPLVLRWR